MKTIALTIISMAMTLNVNASEITILHNNSMVITTSQKVKGHTTTILNADGLTNGTESIKSQLTKNEKESEKIAKSLIPKNKEEMEKGIRALAMIDTWDIKKLPAIVFDNGKYVYYGKNLDKAIKLWEQQK